MKVKKFGGTSVGSAERIKNVGRLISGCAKDIVVLSAMSGSTNYLLEISAAIKKGDKKNAKILIDCLRDKYAGVIDELYLSDKFRNEASGVIDKIFSDLYSLSEQGHDSNLEKEIVAKGEMMSTNLMNIHLHECGINSALLPALVPVPYAWEYSVD